MLNLRISHCTIAIKFMEHIYTSSAVPNVHVLLVLLLFRCIDGLSCAISTEPSLEKTVVMFFFFICELKNFDRSSMCTIKGFIYMAK
jgi:hypothetical protein